MKANEKAKYLVKKFIAPTLINFSDENFERTKKCALILVEEITLYIEQCTPKDDPYRNLMALDYWYEVRREIEKL